MRHVLTIMLMATAMCIAANAQQARTPQTKDIVVADDSLYEEMVNIPFDDKGLDLTVHLTFDEDDNELTLSIAGSRQLFAFLADTQRKKAFTGFWSRRHFRPERLSYATLIEPKTKYKLTSKVVKSFAKPRRRHLFNKWLDNLSPCQTPIGRPTLSLTPDSLVQRFKVDPTATKASFTLRNILVLDPKEEQAIAAKKRNKGKTLHYRFVLDNDFSTTYNISIRRNPCFAMQPFVDSARTRVADVRTAYRRLLKSCPTGKATSQTEVNIFNQHRQYLLSQYVPTADSTSCGELMNEYRAYNSYIDSIAAAPCVFVPIDEGTATASTSIGISAENIMSAAKRLDDIVASIMVSDDATEMHDLRNLGREIVRIVNTSVASRKLRGSDQRKAYAIFKKAEEYFMSVTMKL